MSSAADALARANDDLRRVVAEQVAEIERLKAELARLTAGHRGNDPPRR